MALIRTGGPSAAETIKEYGTTAYSTGSVNAGSIVKADGTLVQGPTATGAYMSLEYTSSYHFVYKALVAGKFKSVSRVANQSIQVTVSDYQIGDTILDTTSASAVFAL